MNNLLITGSSWRSVYITATGPLPRVSSADRCYVLKPHNTHSRRSYLETEDNNALDLSHTRDKRDITIWKVLLWNIRACSIWIASIFWINILFDRSNEKEHEHFTGHLKDTILRYVSQHIFYLLYEFTILLIFKLLYVRVSKF